MSPLVALTCSVFAVVAAVAVNKAERPVARAMALILGASTLVPLVSAPRELVVAFLAFSVVISYLGSRRSRETSLLNRRTTSWPAYALVAYTVAALTISGQAHAREWTLAATAIVIMKASSRLRAGDLVTVANTLLPFVIFHLMYSVGELYLSLSPIWPMGDGTTDISFRPNFLFTSLSGRPMSSFAHPIPMATFATVTTLLFSYLAIQLQRRAYWLASMASVSIVLLSGTRSAVIATVVGVTVLLMTSRRVGSAFKSNVMALVAVTGGSLLVNSSGLLSLIGLGSEFKDSNSYQYRISILGNATRVLDQSLVHVLLGWGGNREEVLQRHILNATEFGVLFFDNQFIASAALFGVVGLGLFIATIVLSSISGGSLTKGILAAFIIMGFSFDFLQYLTPALLFYSAACLPVVASVQTTYPRPAPRTVSQSLGDLRTSPGGRG